MKAAATLLIAATAALAGCGTPPANGRPAAGETGHILQDDWYDVKCEVRDLRGEIDRLRNDLVRLEAQVREIARAERSSGETGNGAAGTKELWEKIARVSDISVCWLGELRGLQFYLCPVTKEEETKIFRDQLGDNYAYMWLYIRNTNKSGTGYSYVPKRGLFSLEIEGEEAGGRSRFETSFDPREVIKVREIQLGTKLGLEEHFEEKIVLPAQTIQTHVLVPKSVDFAKVKAVRMGQVEMPELRP